MDRKKSKKHVKGTDNTKDDIETIERTYGIGATLLQKLGHKIGEGLGTDGNKGISKPIESISRPNPTVGLGYEEREKTRPKRHERLYHSSNEEMGDEEPGLEKKEPPESVAIPRDEDVLIGAIKKLYKDSIENQRSLQLKYDIHALKIERLNKELESTSNRLNKISDTKIKGSKCLDVLRKMHKNIFNNSSIDVLRQDIGDLHELVRDLAISSDPEYLYKFSHVLYIALGSVICTDSWIQRYFHRPDLYSKEPEKEFFHLLSSVCTTLHEHSGIASRPTDPMLLHQSRYKHSMSLYDYIFHEFWFPMIEKIFSGHDIQYTDLDTSRYRWSILYSPDYVLEYLQEQWCIVPMWIQERVLKECIIPLFQDLIQSWEPSAKLSLHNAILPWLCLWTRFPVLQNTLLESILSRFDEIISQNPNDLLRNDISTWIFPWKLVLSTDQLEKFCNETILPLLEDLSREISKDILDISGPVLYERIAWVFRWNDFIPTSILAGMLESAFFPTWHSAIYQWMTVSDYPDYRGLVNWYSTWKSLFPSALFAFPTVQNSFRKGLDIMNGMLDDPSLSLDSFL
jgi:hypothetical protein